jgi:hypothetical protein
MPLSSLLRTCFMADGRKVWGSLATPDDVMVRLMHTGGLEVTLRHAHNSEISKKHVYQLSFMSRLLHHNESVVHT